MNKVATCAIAAAVATTMAGAVVAQETTFAPKDGAQNAVTELERQIRRDKRRDVGTFGNAGRKVGFTGSVSARASMSKGNSDTLDVGLGARLGYFDGINGHRFTGAYSLAETSGTRTKDTLLLGYDYTRDLANDLYAFGKLNVVYDKFSSLKSDAFVGAGLGYRVINDGQTQWSIQAGPGYRHAKNNAGKVVIKSAAASASSYFKTALGDGMFVTNDTDVLWSEKNTRVTNELGLNMAMSNAMALRTSVVTKYNSKPQAGFKHTDNTLGVSLVYSFN